MKAGIGASRGRYVLISMADGSDDVTAVDDMVGLARAGAVSWRPAGTCVVADKSAVRA